jgi:hypothetical protein
MMTPEYPDMCSFGRQVFSASHHTERRISRRARGARSDALWQAGADIRLEAGLLLSRLYGAVMGARRLLGCCCHSLVRFGATRTGRFEHGGQGGGAERAVTSLICASRASGSARRVVGRRRGLATFCAGLSASLISPSPAARLYRAAQRGHRVLLRCARRGRCGGPRRGS